MTASRILVVDDDPALLSALPETVRMRMDGVEVDVADCGQAALEKIASVDYDAIVSDIRIPGMDGLTLLVEAKAIRPDVPTLLITGHGEHDLAVRALRAGAYDYIQKPIDRDHFMVSLGRAIQARQLRRQVEAQKAALAEHAVELERTVQERTSELVKANEDKDALLKARDHALEKAESAHRRLVFLADASRVLAGSLDSAITLERVVRLAVPMLADYCAVSLINHTGALLNTATAHADPAQEDRLRETYARILPEHLPRLHPMSSVLRTGESIVHPYLADQVVENPYEFDYLQAHRSLGARSAMIVPLVAHGRTIGVMTFGSIQPSRRYGQPDVELAEELARRAALAVDNARLYSEAQQANRIKDEFLATVSHELRTPLTAILGWAQMLRGGNLDDATAQRALSSVERNAKFQAHLIEDLLDISRIVTGKLRLDVRPVELAPVIDAALDAVRPASDAKGIRIQKTVDLRAGYVSGDPDRLQQVIWNLLSNAIKFTPKGGRVHIRLERVDSQVHIAVTDTGQGINPDFLPYMFDLFRQADSSITRSHGGLGLGLAIARHLVEMHGGSIHADSQGEGQGATLTVKLPLVAVRSIDEGAMDGAERPAFQQGLSPERVPTLTGMHVLVVDDEPETRDLLVAVLSQCGAEVRASACTQDALDALKQWNADVLVSDIGMPGEDGYDLIRKVRAMESEYGRRIPAVALTAYARAEDRLRALSAGFQMHVPKPVEPVELATVVASFAWRMGKDR